jgi:hypothetical protein
VPRSTPTVVDDVTVAGRRRVPHSAVAAERDATTYLGTDPDAPWGLSWADRTRPVVSAGGAPPANLRRRLQFAATECATLEAGAVATLRRATSGANG